ncbi:MAG: ribose-phosphate pyrophosphokinase [Burkholderiaceae bacterium]|nr:ribose-phosphate pyrophosphokinase [Burkholderiaceae bacterium]
MNPDMMILGFLEYEAQAQRLAQQLGAAYACVQTHRFPDGESRVTLPAALPSKVIFCRSLNEPNEKLVELLLAAKTARRLGARTLTLVAPYLCYMRQDKAFHDGEAISQHIIGYWLAQLFDGIVTLDPHLHRTPTIAAAVPAKTAVALTAASAIGHFLHQHASGAFILGPDEESRQWVQAVALPGGFDFAVCDKRRFDDRSVRIDLPEVNLRGRRVVLVDDVASTGHTVIEATRQCLTAGAARVDVFVSHALFVEGADEALRAAGANSIWSTDSVSHPGNVVHLAELLAGALQQ